MSTGDLLVALSWVPFAVSIGTLFNRRGALREWSGSVADLRAVRVRGTSFLVGLLMLGVGLTLGMRPGARGAWWFVAAVAAAGLVAFAVYRPRTVPDERGAGRRARHQAARVRLEPRGRTRWAAMFACGCLASVVLIVLAFG